MRLRDIHKKVLNRWKKICLQPIRVYCLHHVTAIYDADSMCAGDWMFADRFKKTVKFMQNCGVEFISLSEAYRHICKDKMRCKKYAVLTFDDGYASLKEILPWLEKQNIPVTLFINGKYLDGRSYRQNPKERYLTKDEIWDITSPLVEIANHGWEHILVTNMTDDEFEMSVERNVDSLSAHPNYAPYWAYTYGVHSDRTDNHLHAQQLIPVYIDGQKNYNDNKVIHREILEEVNN